MSHGTKRQQRKEASGVTEPGPVRWPPAVPRCLKDGAGFQVTWGRRRGRGGVRGRGIAEGGLSQVNEGAFNSGDVEPSRRF